MDLLDLLERGAVNIQFIRVTSAASLRSGIVAHIDGTVTKWDRGPGWRCTCPTWRGGAPTCEHVEAVAALIDPRVFGGRE